MENLPKCLLQTMVHFLAFGMRDVCLEEKGGVKGKTWKGCQLHVF